MPEAPPFAPSLSTLMKNPLLSQHEVESLRAQVRQLRQSVAALENRLAEFETEAENDDDRWSIWPYGHVVSAWNLGRHQFHWFHKKVNKWNLARRNRRYRLQNDGPIGEMRLT